MIGGVYTGAAGATGSTGAAATGARTIARATSRAVMLPMTCPVGEVHSTAAFLPPGPRDLV
jgi:hypothetical protein